MRQKLDQITQLFCPPYLNYKSLQCLYEHIVFTDMWSDSTGTGPPDSDSGEEFLRLPEKLGPNASPVVSKVIDHTLYGCL
jgi:hypothetical protein